MLFFPGAHFRAGARFEGPETIARQIRVVFDEILDFSLVSPSLFVEFLHGIPGHLHGIPAQTHGIPAQPHGIPAQPQGLSRS